MKKIIAVSGIRPEAIIFQIKDLVKLFVLHQHGFRRYPLLQAFQILPKLLQLSRLLQQKWSNRQVLSGHVPSLLQGICQGHSYQEAGLNSPHTMLHHPGFAMQKERKLKMLFQPHAIV